MRDPGCRGAEEHVDREALVPLEDVAHELILAARAARHQQHLRHAVDHLDVDGLHVVGGRAIRRRRNDPHRDQPPARRRQAGHVEPHRHELAIGTEHHLDAVEDSPRRRLPCPVPRAISWSLLEFDADPLAGEALRLHEGRHGKPVAGEHTCRGHEVGHADVRRQHVAPHADSVHGHARPRGGRPRGPGIEAGVLTAVGEHHHTRKRAGRPTLDRACHRLTQPCLAATWRQLHSPVAINRRACVSSRAGGGSPQHRSRVGVEPPHAHVVPGQHRRQQVRLHEVGSQDRPRGGGIVAVGQRHAGTRVNEHGHA